MSKVLVEESPQTPLQKKEMDTLGLPMQPKILDQISPSPNRKSENQVKEIVEAIQDKVKDFNPDADPESEFDTTESIGWFEMCNRYMDCADRTKFYLGLFAALLFGGSMPAFCLLFGDMIDSVGSSDGSDGDSFSSLQTQAKYMIYIGLGVWMFSWFQVTMLSLFSESISFKIKVDYFKKCLEKDAAYYDIQNPAEMASKITKECSSIQRGTGDKVGNIVMACGGFLLGFVFAFTFGWLFTLILLATLPVLLLVGVGMAMSMMGGEDALKAYAQSAGYAEQALQGIKVVHTYGQELLEQRNYGKYLDKSTVAQQKTTFGTAIGQMVMFLIMFLFYAYSFYWGGRLRYEKIMNGDELYSGGSILTIMFCVVFGAMQVGGMAPHFKAVKDSTIAGKLAFDVIDHVPKVPVNDPKSELVLRDTIKGQIEFRDVSFKYPTRQELQILNKLSFTFEAGKTTALVGPSGSGKSTVIQLMERFYDPDSGSVLLDGKDFKTLNLRSMRQLIGYVGQEPVLFNTTIKENMLFAKPTATDDEIEKALKDANAWDFIDEFPDKINTQVGGSGGQLSGGQKQRVAIARAFLKQPKILLLDEATSALDKVNEAAVQDAIDRYRQKTGNITTIVIAHRLSTIKDADTIVVLKNGELKEVGNHDYLLETFPDGVYASFVQKQASAEAQNQSAVEDSPTKQVEKGKKNVTKDPVEEAKLKEADLIDEKREKEVEAIMEKHAEKSPFMKLLPYNKPVIFIVVALIASANNGSSMPIFGLVLAKMLAILSIPPEMFDLEIDGTAMFEDNYLKNEIHKYCLYMTIVACFAGIGSFLQRYMFGSLGNKVTYKIRDLLYSKILEKNIGWFDHRDNGPSVLTSAMAKDTSLVNGVSTESVGPVVEGICAIGAGLAFGFYFCWQESVICLVVSPVMIIGNYLGMQFQNGLATGTADLEKEANLLCGDAIINYKTVQSFGNEEQLLEAYKRMIIPILALQKKAHIKTGFAFGMSQFAQYAVFAAMFYGGGWILKMDFENEKKLDPSDVFIALFAIMFGASQAGTAASMGPEMGKATAAAASIFKIIEHPSEINAIAIDQDSSAKKILNTDEIKGKIEFRNVWFRYPTRKQDFVLKGLQLTINPGEQVALVGESGCGKSTFINLLMRFYDVDFGEVLLDDVNIKEYNLHDLRKGISLVMQEPIIFNYSILENILYGKLDAKNSEILDSTNLANATEFVEGNNGFQLDDSAISLKTEMEKNKELIVDMIGEEKYKEELDLLIKLVEQEEAKGIFQAVEGDVDDRKHENPSLLDIELHPGFETQCGVKGSKLSGGQKQRVAIARTIIRKPKVLLLDEATSALDEDSQKKVQQALENIMKGRTTIIIAHRMSTIENCNKIFVLESGTLKEEGNFEELKAQGGFFSQLQKAKQQ